MNMAPERRTATHPRVWRGARLLDRRLVCLVLTAALLAMLPSTWGLADSGQAAGAGGYRLVDTWPVPESELTWPNAAVALTVGDFQREIYVVDSDPPRVLVLAPDGGALRTIGEGLLQEPRDVAVVYPDGPRTQPDPDSARIFVTEPALGQVLIFANGGEHLRTVTDLGRPWGITGHARRYTVEGRTWAKGEAWITDPAGRRLIGLDHDGDLLRVIPASAADPPLERPLAVASIGRQLPSSSPWLVVADPAQHALLWFDGDGNWITTVPLADGDRPLAPLDITGYSAHGSSSTLIVFTTSDAVYYLHVVDVSRPPFLYRLSVDDADGPVVALATCTACSSVLSHSDVDIPPIYGVRSGRQRLSRWVVRDQGGSHRLRRLCPMVDEGPWTGPWRIAAAVDDTVLVADSNGVLLRFEANGQPRQRYEIGDTDDLAVAAEDRLYVSTRNMPALLGLAGEAVRVLRPNLYATEEDRVGHGLVDQWWRNEPACNPAGHGLQSSVAVSTDGGRVDHMILGWNSSGSPALRQDAASTLHTYWLDKLETAAGYWGPLDSRKVHIITDIATGPEADTILAVERNAGLVHKAHLTQDRSFARWTVPPGSLGGSDWAIQPRTSWPVPGRPDRMALAADGSLFVLTVEGVIWRLDGTGKVVTGWDAAGAPNGPRASLRDIAVGADGRVYAVDSEHRRVLVFAAGPDVDPAVVPTLPPPCTVRTDKNAGRDRVVVHTSVTITLDLAGACAAGESGANDILLLLSSEEAWGRLAMHELATTFVAEVDFGKDRVAVMAYDQSAEVVLDYSQDVAAVRQAIGRVAFTGFDPDHQPLDSARDYILQHARPGANRVVVLIANRFGRREWTSQAIPAGERNRQAGLRTLTVTEQAWGPGAFALVKFIGLAVATRVEDFHVAPDRATLQQVYRQLGRSFSAPRLLRQLAVTDLVPVNMDYVADSASPAADWDAAGRRLTWRADQVPFGGWRASYELVPRELGHWPTNLRAGAVFVDGFGNGGEASFPVPWIEVVPVPTATPVPSATVTASPSPTATATVTVTPRPTAEPRPLHLPVLLHEAPCRPEQAAVDVVLALDASMSMAGAKLAAGQAGARAFVAAVTLGRDRVGLVAFHQEAAVLAELTADRSVLEAAIGGIALAPGTRLDRGLAVALTVLEAAPRAGAERAIVLLTDGRQEGPEEMAETAARALGAAGIALYAVGLGADADLALLARLTGDGRRVYAAGTAAELAAIYEAIAGIIPCPEAGRGR